MLKKMTDRGAGNSRILQACKCMRDSAFLRRRASQFIKPMLAVFMMIFSDISQMRKIRKRPDHGDGLIACQFFKQPVKLLCRDRIGIAPKAHCRLTN